MSEIFQLAPNRSKSQKTIINRDIILSNYTKKQAEFINRSYGYYSNIFIQRIIQDANIIDSSFDVLSAQRILKELVNKFLLTDLQLIFVAHISKILDWNYNQKLIKENSKIFVKSLQNYYQKSDYLQLFLSLVAFYVKNYLGEDEDYKIIHDYIHSQTNNEWQRVYTIWLRDSPHQIFTVSPKTINRLYRQYSQDCQHYNPVKNYNSMVDKILLLSTTYSMIPGECKTDKKKKMLVAQQNLKGRKKIKVNQMEQKIESSRSNLSKLKDHSGLSNKIYDPQQSNNNFTSNIMKKQQQGQFNKPLKKTFLRSRVKSQQINNHITQFYNKNTSSSNQFVSNNQHFRPQSSIGLSAFPSILNNRSSIYQAIPYTLKNNSNVSNFWL